MSMKIVLWATLSANGAYARSTPAHPPRKEALADFAREVASHRAFVVGRRTFEDFARAPERRPQAEMPAADVVVLSRSLVLPEGVPARVVASPRDAIAALRERGRESALVAGGEAVHRAFLAEGLVDELVVLITPWLEDDGRTIALREGERRDATLLAHEDLGGGVVKLRYALGKAGRWDS